VVSESADGQGISWRPGLNCQTTLIGPDLVQRAAGQHWTACVIGSIDGTAYRGSLRNALTTGALPTGFGSCWSSSVLNGPDPTSDSGVPCDRAHHIELLGTTDLVDRVQTAVVQDACAVFAGRVLRTADPTRDGQIRLQVVGLDDRPVILAPSADYLQGRFVACIAMAQSGSDFTGSLVGLGEKPLPTG
jgi:hypothetical protein